MAVNGVYVVLGELAAVVALLRKARRHWHHHHGGGGGSGSAAVGGAALEDTDPLLRSFADLKDVLNEVQDIGDMNPSTFLAPFLDVIRSQNTNGPITESALGSVAKFLSYGLIDANSVKAAAAVEGIAQAVTHTKFIGGANAGSDECVLYKILHVLRALLLSPPGRLLSNESVCDIMQSCFRLCFEQHLSEMLRKAAEATLADMASLIFTRLPTFSVDHRHPYIRKLVMSAKNGKSRRRRKRAEQVRSEEEEAETESDEELKEKKMEGNKQKEDDVEVLEPSTETDVLIPDNGGEVREEISETVINESVIPVVSPPTASPRQDIHNSSADEAELEAVGVLKGDRISSPSELKKRIEAIYFEASHGKEDGEDTTSEAAPADALQMPYGLPCCRELLRFLITLTNPLDRANTESMIVLGLNLLIVALEASADHLSGYHLLLPLLKDDLCRALLQLLDTEKLPIFAAASRACFLLFESMRSSLKFQLESYFQKLRAIVVSEQPRISYELKEMALESIVQLWRIPGLVTELYLNYDCDLYCSNVFEELTKLLAENAFPVAGLRSTSLLSLDALLVVIDTIDLNCHFRRAGAVMGHSEAPALLSSRADDESSRRLEAPPLSGYAIGKSLLSEQEYAVCQSEREEPASSGTLLLRSNRHAAPSGGMPSMSEVIERKKRKRIIAEGTHLFNKSPKKGIEFLREKGLLDRNPVSVVDWLRSNPQLDKNSIGEYICNRNHADVLEAFVHSFPFAGARLDVSLRSFLEAFRLPGEAPLISMVMQHFADSWHTANGEPFNHVDAAFTLGYAVIMLNTDQHNPTARRNQPPMTAECFKRNLSGTNGGKDFDPEMLEQIFNAIKSEELVMPAEQAGLIKENYLWRVLLRRGETSEGVFTHAPNGWNDQDLFAISWGPAIAALSYVFDKTENDIILQKALNGYRKCASIAAHYGMSDVFDNLIIHLCKFSTLMTAAERAGEDNVERERQRAVAAAGAGGQAGSDSGAEGLAVLSPEAVAIAFGENAKAHAATRTLFQLVHANGDILREGWKNVLDVLLHLFRSRLLPSELTEVEDFVDEKGWVSILRQHVKPVAPARSDGGLLSWLGIGGGAADSSATKKPTPEQEKLIKIAASVIADCKPSQLVTDSKYLTSSALSELLSAFTHASGAIVAAADEKTQKKSISLSEEDEDSLIFFLELIISISLENKDRLAQVWRVVRQHVEWLLSRRFGRSPVIVERAVVGMLRVANRNLFRERDSVADDIIQSLAILLRLPPSALYMLSRQISFGLHDLLRQNAANVHKREHWVVLFALLEASGAAVSGEDAVEDAATFLPGGVGGGATDGERNAFSDVERMSNRSITATDRGYTSDDPSKSRTANYSSNESLHDSAVSLPRANSNEWIHLDHQDAARATEDALRALRGGGAASASAYARGSLVLRARLGRHEPAAFLKVAETLSFLFRDAAHVTPENFDSCVQCLRTFVEASLDGGRYAAGPLSGDAQNALRSKMARSGEPGEQRKEKHSSASKKELSMEVEKEEAERARNEEQQLSSFYLQVSLQLLDACHTLHVRARGIYEEWASASGENAIDASVSFVWSRVWRPLLQAIARLCGDCRRQIRAQALNYLVRAFLLSELHQLGSAEWESCYGEVLFPLLSQLLTSFSPMDPIGMEETRVRAIQLVAKIMLNHLTALACLPSFPPLWLRLLDYMEKYAGVESSDLLSEAVPEALKNMLLVLSSTGTFRAIPGLHEMTIGKIRPVLPKLIDEVLPTPPAPTSSAPPAGESNVSLVSAASSQPRRVFVAPATPVPSSSSSIPTPQPDLPTSSESSLPHQPMESLSQQDSNRVDILDGQASKAVYIPELTEVIVHSGATSPVAGSPPSAPAGFPPESEVAGNEESATPCMPPPAMQPQPQLPAPPPLPRQQQQHNHIYSHDQPPSNAAPIAAPFSSAVPQVASSNSLGCPSYAYHQQYVSGNPDHMQQQMPVTYQQQDPPPSYQAPPTAYQAPPISAPTYPLPHVTPVHLAAALQSNPLGMQQYAYGQPILPAVYSQPEQQQPSSFHSVANPLPIFPTAYSTPSSISNVPYPSNFSLAAHMAGQAVASTPATQLAPSPNSAFSYISDSQRQHPQQPSTHQPLYPSQDRLEP